MRSYIEAVALFLFLAVGCGALSAWLNLDFAKMIGGIALFQGCLATTRLWAGSR